MIQDGKNADGTFEIKWYLVRINNTTLDLNLNDISFNPKGENKIIICQNYFWQKNRWKNYNVTLVCQTNDEALTSDLYWKSGMSGTSKDILNMTNSTSRVNELSNNSNNVNRFNFTKVKVNFQELL